MTTWTRREALQLAAAAGLAGILGQPLVRAAAAAKKEIGRSLAYRDGVLAKGPVGYWRLGEDVGPTAADETANQYDGTYLGDPTFGTPGAIVGDPDTAVQFHGTDYVEIPDSEDFSQPTSEVGLTVEAWMRADALDFIGETENPYVHWLGKGVAGRIEWAFRFYSRNTATPNRISAYIWSPSGGLGAGAHFDDTLVVGEWMHVVACYEPGDANTQPPAGVHVYKNGVHRQGPPANATLYSTYSIFPAHGTAPLRFATRDLNSFLVGALDEVAIYPRVLSGDEIWDNYQNGIAP